MNRIDDDMLMAFADGELNEINRARIARAVAGDPALQARLEAQRKLRAQLRAHYDPTLDEELPERFRLMLDGDVADLAAERARRARPQWQSIAALAATLVLGLVLGQTLRAPGGPVGIVNGQMIAQGWLADALDTQLASASAPDAAARIGISFAATDGRMCRTFDSASLAGLACRGEAGWQLMMTTGGSGAAGSGYRQAGSGSLLVAQAVQELMAGAALDAEAERRARDARWRPGGVTDRRRLLD